jgi:hypothetical protein
MQALYQLSYSPVLISPGLPGDIENITRSPRPTTKSIPLGADMTRFGRLADVALRQWRRSRSA